jgi:acetyltransferase
MKNIQNFWEPKSIAVIGASHSPKKLGFQILKNLVSGGFLGRIYAENPNAKKILGFNCYTSVLDIPSPVDLALIVVPAPVVAKVLIECGKKLIKNAVIISAGFSETGGEGRVAEKKLSKISQKYNISILGPNTLGFMKPKAKINLTFARSKPIPGELALVTQSGALGSAILDWAGPKKIGISLFASLGNKLDITENDILNYLKNDAETKVVLLYLEWASEGKELVKILSEITPQKPIIVLIGGITSAGAHAATSHTGALAGGKQALLAAASSSNCLIAQNISEALNLILALTREKIPTANKISVITNAGGPGILATDEIIQEKLILAPLSDKTKKELSNKLSERASIANPIDLIGDAQSRDYENALKIVSVDPNVDSILVLLTPQTSTEIVKTARILAQIKGTSKKPIFASFLGGAKIAAGQKILDKSAVASFLYPDAAVKAISQITRYGSGKKSSNKDKLKSELEVDRALVSELLKKGNYESLFNLLDQYQIPIPKIEEVDNKDDLLFKAQRMRLPLVLKTLSPEIIHKAASDGVILDIGDEKG